MQHVFAHLRILTTQGCQELILLDPLLAVEASSAKRFAVLEYTPYATYYAIFFVAELTEITTNVINKTGCHLYTHTVHLFRMD